MKKVKLVVQHFEGCPNGSRMLQIVKEALDELKDKVDVDFQEILVESQNDAFKYAFRGSPTVLINGIDLEGMPKPLAPAMSCRFYNNFPDKEVIINKILNASLHNNDIK